MKFVQFQLIQMLKLYELNFDSIPDQIMVTLVDKNSVIGSVETYPYRTYPIPQATGNTGYKLRIEVNAQDWRTDPCENNPEAYFRLNESLYKKFNNPMLPRKAIEDDSDTGYHFYGFTLTNTPKGADGIMYEDRRSGSIELFCELQPGAVWPENYEWMIHAFTQRNFSIDPEGQVSKNFL